MNTVEINWTVVSYFLIGLFAISGFFKGWWKEAITTLLLGILLLLLQLPQLALSIINTVNSILQTIWNWLPDSVHQFMAAYFGLTSLQIDPGSAQTWLVILILALALSMILSRWLLPNRIRRGRSGYVVYPVTPLGNFLGGLLGGLNGFLIINLVREYIDGRNLPAGTEIATANAGIAGPRGSIASSGVDFGFIDLPDFSPFNSTWAWIIIGLGLFIFLLVVVQRLTRSRTPAGHERYRILPKRDKDGNAAGMEWQPERTPNWAWYKFYLDERS